MSYETPQMYRWREPGAPPNSPALSIHFMLESHLNAAVTAEKGIQSYDSVLMGYVAPIGNPKSNASVEIERTAPDGTVTVNAYNMNRYGQQVKEYKAGTNAETLGTPLKDLLGMTPATAMNLKARGINTIEMLADAVDGAGQDIMGFWALRERAQKHMEHRKEQAPFVRLDAIEAKYEAENADLKRQLDELKALLSAGGDIVPKRGPGRPRKDEAAEAA